ncbi:Nramp family divalent metal transporter [Mucilaginibacter ginsenosidivorans]|uniref:Divalent metal cation transporter n=1 Tax=Mucilaginibacter ginsenosidivorans TaxID=398053 RepID=A0A5B8USQ3_9SPHI|nr:Nramp family divalent metal transporter [Mucilaginibacter ginsenosidivorans]QEC62137.1 divalent metal cation transporter [Mucilaginibacter ginsenosidivorans]
MPAPKRIFKKTLSVLKTLGPGLVTGSSDDDPSGIATYSQAGAQFGFSMLWTALITFPLMASMQEMCARIGLVTGGGLASTLKNHYPKWILWLMIIFSFPAIVLNIGADIAGMGAAAHLICPAVPSFIFTIVFTALIIVAIIYYPYQKLAAALKWACITLLVYLAVPFFTDTKWLSVLRHTFIPNVEFNRDFVGMMVAILGTTISPYLFFWQATMEAEGIKQSKAALIVDKRVLKDMRKDVDIGMLFSNIVMFFIILTCGNVLYPNGVHQIETVEQAAVALKPIAGNLAYTLFAIGIIGTGFLAIPVLSGSLSYMFAETFDWDEGLDKKFSQAKPFYAVIVIALVIGLLINFTNITPLQGLIYSAMLYGITSPVIILIVLHISNNRRIMGDNVNSLRSNIMGAITFLLMLGAALALFI